MLGGELLAHLRTDVLRDTAVPYLWSDDYLLRMLNEAQRQFARRTYCILDTYDLTTTMPATDVNGNLSGTAVYALPKETLFVWSAQIDWQSLPMANWARRRLPTTSLTAIGLPNVFTTDENVRSIRFYPVPDGLGGYNAAAGPYLIHIRRAIRPTEDLTADTEPQIPEEYHLDLCEFVAWKALLLPDEDTQNIALAKEFEKQWNDRVSAAKGEVYYRMLGPDAYAQQNWTMSNTGMYGSGFVI